MLEILCIIAGVILLIWGWAVGNMLLLVLGIILLACGGVWVFFFDGDEWF